MGSSLLCFCCFWYNIVHPGRQELWKQLNPSNTGGTTPPLFKSKVKSRVFGFVSERARGWITISECHTYKDQSI